MIRDNSLLQAYQESLSTQEDHNQDSDPDEERGFFHGSAYYEQFRSKK
jgi:hypothetical protein